MMEILTRDDALYRDTDGVTEARNVSGEEFSEDRCKSRIDQVQSQPLQMAPDDMRRPAASVTGTEVLEGDLTMMALRHKV